MREITREHILRVDSRANTVPRGAVITRVPEQGVECWEPTAQADLHPPLDSKTIQTTRVRSDDSSIPDFLRSPHCGRDARNDKKIILLWDQGIVSHLADEHANVTHIIKRTITLNTPSDN